MERWQGRARIIAVWMMIRQQMVCVIFVYGPQPGRTEAEKEAFREEVERMAGLSDCQTMLCVAGDFNAHIGVVEPGYEASINSQIWEGQFIEIANIESNKSLILGNVYPNNTNNLYESFTNEFIPIGY